MCEPTKPLAPVKRILFAIECVEEEIGMFKAKDRLLYIETQGDEKSSDFADCTDFLFCRALYLPKVGCCHGQGLNPETLKDKMLLTNQIWDIMDAEVFRCIFEHDSASCPMNPTASYSSSCSRRVAMTLHISEAAQKQRHVSSFRMIFRC